MTRERINLPELVALGVAIVLHALLGLALWFQPDTRVAPPPIERVTVNLSEEAGMQSAAPDPVRESRAAEAPTLSDSPAPMFEPFERSEITPAPRAVAAERPSTRPAPTAAPTAAPRAQATAPPRARPTQRATRAPTPRATNRSPARSESRPAPRASPRASSQASTRATSPPARSGGSKIGDNFLEGSGTSTASNETRVPASQIGASAKASLLQALSRQLKPHWSPPDGPDVDKIVSVVSFSLSPDGSLSGKPRLRSQSGVNATNRAQADRHAEQAVRAVQLAAPFDLPDQFYEGWKRATISFDWKLSQ